MELKNHITQGFYGGISQDDHLGGKAQVLDSKGIDNYSNSQFATLNKALTVSCNTTKQMKQAYSVTDPVSNQTNVFFFGESGYIYKDGTDTPVYTGLSISNLYYHIFELGDYLYFTDNNGDSLPMGLHRILKGNTPAPTWSISTNITTTGDAIPNFNYAESHPVVTSAGVAYMAVGRYLSRLNGLLEVKTIDLGQEIGGLSTIGGNIYVYYQDGKIDVVNPLDMDTGTQPGGDLGFPVARIKQIGNTVYGIKGHLGENLGLFYMNGLQAVEIFVEGYSDQLSRDKFKFQYESNLNSLAYGNRFLYGFEEIDGKSALFSFGMKIRGLPESYIIQDVLSTASIVDATFIFIANGYLYLWYNDSDGFAGVKKRALVNPSGYLTSGEIITLVDNIGDDIYQKNINTIYFRVLDVTATETVKVYASINGEAYTLTKTITEQPLDNLVRISKTELPKGDLRDVSLKFELTGDGSNTPKVFSTLLFKEYSKNVK